MSSEASRENSGMTKLPRTSLNAVTALATRASVVAPWVPPDKKLTPAVGAGRPEVGCSSSCTKMPSFCTLVKNR